MDISKKLINVKTQKEYPMSNPDEELIREILKRKGITDLDKKSYVEIVTQNLLPKEATDELPKETIGNVMLNCVISYLPEDKKESWQKDLLGQILIGNEKEIEIKEKHKKLLEKILWKSEYREKGEGKEKTIEGIYPTWVIIQALKELGIKPPEDLDN